MPRPWSLRQLLVQTTNFFDLWILSCDSASGESRVVGSNDECHGIRAEKDILVEGRVIKTDSRNNASY